MHWMNCWQCKLVQSLRRTVWRFSKILKIELSHDSVIPLLGIYLAAKLLLSHFSRVRLCATPQMAAHQAPLSLGFSRQEHWSGLPFPSPVHESEKWKWSRSVMSDSSRPHGLQPTRLLCPWDFLGKNTGVGCHCFLWGIYLETTIIRKDTCTPMFTAALLTKTKTWKQPKCPSTEECIKEDVVQWSVTQP